MGSLIEYGGQDVVRIRTSHGENRLNSSPPKKVPYMFPKHSSTYMSATHANLVVYPSYEAYIGGVLDYDYDIQGYKDGSPVYPAFRQTRLVSLPWNANFRWNRK